MDPFGRVPNSLLQNLKSQNEDLIKIEIGSQNVEEEDQPKNEPIVAPPSFYQADLDKYIRRMSASRNDSEKEPNPRYHWNGNPKHNTNVQKHAHTTHGSQEKDK